MDSLDIHPGMPCPTLLCSESGPPLEWSNSRFRGCLSTGRVAYGRLLPLWTAHAERYGTLNFLTSVHMYKWGTAICD
jgi:hypothetical protein